MAAATDDVFVVVKPAGRALSKAIVDSMAGHGFTVVRRAWHTLSSDDAEILYPYVFEQLRDRSSRVPGPYWANHVRYLGSATSLLAVVRHPEDGAHARMRELKGASPYSDRCAPGTIRYDFPGPSVFNSFHSCDEAAESAAMQRHFRLTADS